MNKKTKGFLILLTVVLFLLAGLGMLNRAEQRNIDEQIADLKSASRIQETVSEPAPTDEATDNQTTQIEPNSSAEDWAHVMEMYDSLAGFNSKSWSNIYMQHFGKRHPGDWPEEMLKDVVVWVDEAQSFLAILRSVTAEHKSIPIAEWLENAEDPLAYRSFENIARIIYFDSIVWSAKGDDQKPFESIIAGIRMANSLIGPRDVYSKSFSEYKSVYSTMLHALPEAYPSYTLSDTQLNTCLYDTQNGYRREQCLMDFQANALKRAQEHSDGDKKYLTLHGLGEALKRDSYKSKIGYSIRWMGHRTVNRKELREQLNYSVQHAQTAQKLTPAPLYELIRQARKTKTYFRRWELNRQAKFETHLDITTLGLLVEQFKNVKGTYPESLDQLQMPFQQALPKDVYTGKTYMYEVTDQGFKLYGFGINPEDFDDPNDERMKDYYIIWRDDNRYEPADPTESSDEVREELLAVVQ